MTHRTLSGIILFGFVLLLVAAPQVSALTPSAEVNQKCMANLEKLAATLKKFLAEGGKTELPEYLNMKEISRILGAKYLPQPPQGIVHDCAYFLMFKNANAFDFCCNVHGCLRGDDKISIRYYEYGFTPQINSRWKQNSKYNEHIEYLRRWSVYSPTVVERLKFNYGNNPSTTIVIVVFGLIVLWFLYRSYLA